MAGLHTANRHHAKVLRQTLAAKPATSGKGDSAILAASKTRAAARKLRVRHTAKA